MQESVDNGGRGSRVIVQKILKDVGNGFFCLDMDDRITCSLGLREEGCNSTLLCFANVCSTLIAMLGGGGPVHARASPRAS